MKTYFVTTADGVNDHKLHSLNVESYKTHDLDDANRVFEQEVECLKREYVSSNDLPYTPSEKAFTQAVTCSIILIDEDDPYGPDGVEYVRESDQFYPRTR